MNKCPKCGSPARHIDKDIGMGPHHTEDRYRCGTSYYHGSRQRPITQSWACTQISQLTAEVKVLGRVLEDIVASSCDCPEAWTTELALAVAQHIARAKEAISREAQASKEVESRKASSHPNRRGGTRTRAGGLRHTGTRARKEIESE